MSKLYEKVAEQISDLVEKGVYLIGDRVPSVRQLSQEFEVRASRSRGFRTIDPLTPASTTRNSTPTE